MRYLYTWVVEQGADNVLSVDLPFVVTEAVVAVARHPSGVVVQQPTCRVEPSPGGSTITLVFPATRSSELVVSGLESGTLSKSSIVPRYWYRLVADGMLVMQGDLVVSPAVTNGRSAVAQYHEWEYDIYGEHIDTGDPNDNVNEIVIQNTRTDQPHTVVTIAGPTSAGADKETTISMVPAEGYLFDTAFQSYEGEEFRVYFNLKNWGWDYKKLKYEFNVYARNISTGLMQKNTVMKVGGENLIIEATNGFSTPGYVRANEFYVGEWEAGVTQDVVIGTKKLIIKAGIIVGVQDV